MRSWSLLCLFGGTFRRLCSEKRSWHVVVSWLFRLANALYKNIMESYGIYFTKMCSELLCCSPLLNGRSFFLGDPFCNWLHNKHISFWGSCIAMFSLSVLWFPSHANVVWQPLEKIVSWGGKRHMDGRARCSGPVLLSHVEVVWHGDPLISRKAWEGGEAF